MQLRQVIRSDLRFLTKGGATTRVLDLHSIALKHGHTDAYADQPFFNHPRLNKCFVIKHTVRAHERPYVMSSQPVVTKILIPLASQDLALGGHAVFVEEVAFADKIRAQFTHADEPHLTDLDLIRLRELAALPSFDPFLLKERFRTNARPIADCYFEISQDEVDQMIDSVAEQIIAVVSLAFQAKRNRRNDERALDFARQLLSSEDAGRLDALRLSLEMTSVEFERGIFGWKGILYYRWCMGELFRGLKNFLAGIREISVIGTTQTERAELERMRRMIIAETRQRWVSLSKIMEEYETVFSRFCKGEDARGFQNFLLKAPGLFYDIGSDISIVNHVPGYWRFWMKTNTKGYLHAREALPLFTSFVTSVTRSRAPDGMEDELYRRRSDTIIPQPEVFIPPAA
ncbi:MAG: hypothetical protein GYB36_05395 [Alphaproteobacteria bacterium]|nr:hypothetical protein [Alphaproteobacteria bacterium]